MPLLLGIIGAVGRVSGQDSDKDGQTVRKTPESDTKLGWYCLSVRPSVLVDR